VPRSSEEVAVPRRRTFTADFKREVLVEVDAASTGEIGAILRRRGLYSSHLTKWRQQRDEGTLAGLAPKKRGRKAHAPNPLAQENATLQRELGKATARAERAERLLELQKKVAELFGETLAPPPPERMPPSEEPAAPPSRRRRKRS
jgi:transposase-like protein